MANTNINWLSMSDKSIVSIIGEYIKHQRIIQNKTQATIAEVAGINRWTMSKIENGEPISLTSLIQILRTLNLLDLLNVFKIQSQLSPLELAKLDKQKRQRASKDDESYQFENKQIREITLEDGQLHSKRKDSKKTFKIYPISENYFIFEGIDFVNYHFSNDEIIFINRTFNTNGVKMNN